MSRSPRVILVVFALGCSNSQHSADAAIAPSDAGPPDAGIDRGRVELQVNLAPSRLRESGSDAFRVLPQSYEVSTLLDAARITTGPLVLAEPIMQYGSVLGFRVNPSVAAVPGEDVPVPARIRLHRPGSSFQSYVTETDFDGVFATWAVPGEGYRLEIVPYDPLLPLSTEDVTITSPALDLDRELGAGVPVYGRVTSPTGPVEGARVSLTDAFGAVSATAITDGFGVYQVRAMPGTWTVVCSGRDAGLDPTLRFPDQVVGEVGLNLDVGYPAPLEPVLARGEVESGDGDRVGAASVRLVAESLDGYESLDESFETEVFANASGTFLGLVPRGTYTIDVLPPEDAGDGQSPRRLEGVRLDGGAPLDTVVLDGLVAVTGDVRGASGEPVASARVECTESGFGGRSWETFTGDQGEFSLELASVPMDCVAQPPGDRDQLAAAYRSFDPTRDQNLAFDLQRGQVVEGTVITAEGDPEPTVVVEVRDPAGRVLGSGLTNGDGVFTIAVDLSGLGE